jgi:hypothetical protein
MPLLLFEVAWKFLWLAVVALPLRTAGQVDQATQDLTSAILWVTIPLAVIPWRYVFAQYVTERESGGVPPLLVDRPSALMAWPPTLAALPRRVALPWFWDVAATGSGS